MTAPVLHALVPAAGEGSRLGGQIPKQYAEIAGQPVLAHAVAALARHPRVAGVTVVTAPGDLHFARMKLQFRCPVDRVDGGASRARSVLNGLRHVGRHHAADWILVHDAARPCLSAASLDRLLEQGLAHADGAILAMPVRDTLKRGNAAGHIEATVDRSSLWAAQTPQLFPLEALTRALRNCLEQGVEPTDEAAAMETRGAHPLLVPGSAANIKITWPQDLAVAEAWLVNQATSQ